MAHGLAQIRLIFTDLISANPYKSVFIRVLFLKIGGFKWKR